MSEPLPSEKGKSGKFSKLKSYFQNLEQDEDKERFSSFNGHPFDRERKGFSTFRSEVLHGIVLKPIDKYLEREDAGEGDDSGLLSGIWHFDDDEDDQEPSEDQQ
ncbi:MAG: hypothetical protein P8J01_09245 [Acidimicrobiales bacterium]|nr:hypothetical protein [Acidimicrobiales bacterium]